MNLLKPVSVQTFEALNRRMIFDSNQAFWFQTSQSGVKGEFDFWEKLSQQSFPHIPIYDSEFEIGLCPQLDFIVIASEAVFLYDVKNYEGNYYYNDGNFESEKRRIHSPLTQLDRAYDVLDILLRQRNIHLPIVKKLIFINPNFTLYGNQDDLPIIMHSQLETHFKKVLRHSAELGDYHRQTAAYIERSKIRKEYYNTKINYSYESLEKDVWCGQCSKQKMIAKHKHFCCPECQQYETKFSAVERSLKEFKLLFPGKRIGASLLRDWCGETIQRLTATEVLKREVSKSV